MSPRGRRPAGTDTRAEIVHAASRVFASKGYQAASLRGIARDAGVDPALVHHYFAGKRELFVEAMRLPFDPAERIGAMVAGPPEQLGERIAAGFFAIWEVPESRERFVALVRSAVSDDDAGRMLREFVAREIVGRIGAAAVSPDGGERAALVASQLIGLAMLRYVVRVPQVTDVPLARLVEQVAPTLQRYLTED
ncbi:MAG TPA: TetR family transcriptional regulator [Segeticoccus sp.]|uniref:TetR/AcrR family transcriptional regulator n=1 Tax=Segeticoccus sp. TaxID=2706531 RepID=UPI002D7E88C6|nr:TetR family transcriptional regulator [Segeticoccus sp.]HET8599163.1 TetR family transcriptional regulator [Segeticoccus sp.]